MESPIVYRSLGLALREGWRIDDRIPGGYRILKRTTNGTIEGIVLCGPQ